MNPFRICIALLALSTFAATAASAPVHYTIDSSHSTVQFVVAHLGVSRVVGRFNEISGDFTCDVAKMPASSVRINLKSASIDTALAQRDADLRSSDFFRVAEYPEIRFTSASVTGTPEKFALAGMMRLLGVSRPVTFQVSKIGESRDPWGGYRAGFEATTTLKRSDFGMRYMLGPIGDDITVTVDIEGIRQP